MKKRECITVLIIVIATSIGTYSVFEKIDGTQPNSGLFQQEVLKASALPIAQTIVRAQAQALRQSVAKVRHKIAQTFSDLVVQAEVQAEPVTESPIAESGSVSSELPVPPADSFLPTSSSQITSARTINLFDLDMRILPTMDVASISLEEALAYHDLSGGLHPSLSAFRGIKLSLF